MTKWEAIKWVNDRMCWGRGKFTKNHPPTIDECWEAGAMAIEALQVNLVRCGCCEYSQPADDYQDSYWCYHPTHNREYLVFSRCYCSYGERKNDD